MEHIPVPKRHLYDFGHCDLCPQHQLEVLLFFATDQQRWYCILADSSLGADQIQQLPNDLGTHFTKNSEL